jgi:chromosomal replication initiation ATPase DnaA
VGALDSATLCGTNSLFLLEDIETIADEKAFFHLLRHGETHPVNLLLTSKLNAKELHFTLPDLRSRLLALPTAAIVPPDEALLGVFLAKWFADRQMRVSEDVISYILRRIERSFDAAQRVAQVIERYNVENKKPVTIPAIKPFLQ